MLAWLDVTLFYLINKGCSNRFFDLLMPLVSGLGSGEFLFVISVIILILNRNKKEKRALGILLLAGLTATYYATYALKVFVARPRPFVVLADVHRLAEAAGFSFPSGHAMQSFMAATVLSKYFKRYGVYFFAAAGLVAFSRVYIGVHFVSDVIAGAALGSAIGYGLTAVVKME